MAWELKKFKFFLFSFIFIPCLSSVSLSAPETLVDNTKDYIVLRTMADAARWEAFFSKSEAQHNSLDQLSKILDFKATTKFEEIKNPL